MIPFEKYLRNRIFWNPSLLLTYLKETTWTLVSWCGYINCSQINIYLRAGRPFGLSKTVTILIVYLLLNIKKNHKSPKKNFMQNKCYIKSHKKSLDKHGNTLHDNTKQ